MVGGSALIDSSFMATITFGSTGMETTGGGGVIVAALGSALGGATAGPATGPATGSTARAALAGGIAPDERARRGVDCAGVRAGDGMGGVPTAKRPMGSAPAVERTGMCGIAVAELAGRGIVVAELVGRGIAVAELAGRLSDRGVAAGGGGGGRLVGRAVGCMPRRSVCA